MKISELYTFLITFICIVIFGVASIVLWQHGKIEIALGCPCVQESTGNLGETKNRMIVLTIEEIEGTTSRRKLLALAYRLEADAKAGDMTPELYTELSLLLAKKLGFGITPENLEKAVRELAE